MKVIIKTAICGLGFSYACKSVVEMQDTTAKAWIDAGVAEETNDDAKVNFVHAAIIEPTNEDDSDNCDLPKDLPGREQLITAEILTIEAIKEVDDLTSIKGIGEKTKEQILSYLTEE